MRPGGAFLLDDLGDDFRGYRLDVGRVSELRIGHDGGGVRVHQNDAIALVLQRLYGLGAGVVELACLADNDRPGPDDKDGINVGAFGHGSRNVGLQHLPAKWNYPRLRSGEPHSA